jgi:aminoglycoside phosphotransferase (APT) family kinase protein
VHEGEVVATIEQVRRLVDFQHPSWRDLPLAPVAEHGTDHVLFRLGDDLVCRMPRAPWAVEQAVSDDRWLPVLAPHLPAAVPAPVALGEPGEGYPWTWSVAPWLPGRAPTAYDDALVGLGGALASFVRALRTVEATDGPVKPEGTRGAPVRGWDEPVREAIEACGDLIDRVAVTEVWDDVVAAPDWAGEPVWLHGDLLAGNLVVDGRDRLTGVIDWGALGTGDPAPDLQPWWNVLPPGERAAFRDQVDLDDDTWRRGRGWAIGPALTGIPYYWDTVPAFAQRGLRTIEVVLSEHRSR